MSSLHRSTVEVVATITCAWLFYFLSGFLVIGTIKFEVNILTEDHETVTREVDKGGYLGTSWIENTQNVFAINMTRKSSFDSTPQQLRLVMKIKITKRYRDFVSHNKMLGLLMESAYLLVSATLTAIFIWNIGSAVRKLLDIMITSSKDGSSPSKLKTIASSVLLSIACLFVYIPIINILCLKCQAMMEEQIIQHFSRSQNVKGIYLFGIQPLGAFYFSTTITGFFLIFSHWVPAIIEISPKQNNANQLTAFTDVESLVENDGRMHQTEVNIKGETACRTPPSLVGPTRILSDKENELRIIVV